MTATEIVLMADPKIAAIPVEDCGEPLVDVREFGLELRPEQVEDGEPYALLRSGVVERLLRAQDSLPDGLRLVIVEGYRPPDLQRHYFEEYEAELRALHPAWGASRIRTAASRYVSPPEIAPHSAGGAVDLTLADAEGRELDMGTRMNASPEESAGACYTDGPGVPPEARERRAVLGAALQGAGLVNYPTEWWHWSYGDRYWALAQGERAALYGPQG
ncbi:D-alanyl-D-alanine dipeptidase [Streptomyces spiroverticillatus]|uniref:D-alanyl-D-alanine dipeptidase n=1 Tax=Streptomyces finlayi TaxID=67296 RepID=A0A918X4J8_9ACTN|nr:M15 family metallopeptidase [Streptomyces finlayi]GHA33798.1 D-alanyl-D-alanine dipeptidase [Streptomyces spiroverticillatus]GHD11484.1 D-alanyl-D-alanine dipeptidase [Streptomyces finlayi]